VRRALRFVVVLVSLTAFAQTLTAAGDRQPAASSVAPVLPQALARMIDPVINAIWSRFSRRAAMAHVRVVSQYWRIGGNAGYDAALDHIHTRLIASGFADGQSSHSSTWFEEYPNSGKGWEHSIGTLAIAHDGRPDEVVLSRALQHIALCINSFSTRPEGLLAPLVDVGHGDRDEDYAGKDVKGAVVLGGVDAGALWRRAVANGALGIVSTGLGEYVSPDPPGAAATPRDQWEILQWSSIPYDEARHGFGFKATPRAAASLRQALASHGGHVAVHVTIASTFSSRPVRTLVAEIPGRLAPSERIVIAAHVQEPGANDNASGVATLAELARALRIGVRNGTIPRPERTITFLWLEEISGSRRWLQDHQDQARNVRYMFSMDMTGENVTKTGGSFLIERWPDPGAVWDRPWDPHTEWGRGDVRVEQLKGDLINDLHLAVCERVATRTGWTVKTNPYEGGSDHTVFGAAGIPAVLDWHFTDRYYHTNFDTPDKTSPREMRNVGVAVAASAWLLASARESTALAVAALVANSGQARIALEDREGTRLALTEPDRPAAASRQAAIVSAWRKWSAEAVRSTSRLVVGPVTPQFAEQIGLLAAPLERPEVPR
jgi:aminopeptidase YwaD